ncbi:S24 family peptidase [Chitinibacteraceae bacterium HSL-7]
MDVKTIRLENLRALITQAGGNAALAERVETAPAYISQILSTKHPATVGDKLARKIEDRLELGHGWMDHQHTVTATALVHVPAPIPPVSMSAHGASGPAGAPNVQANLRPVATWDNEDELPQGQYFFIPAYALRVSCGDGAVAFEVDTQAQPMAMTRAWAQRNGFAPDQLFTVRAAGHSMAPRIEDGASVTILKHQPGEHIVSGKIYLIVFDGQWYLKYLTPQPTGDIVVRSEDHQNHPHWTIPASRIDELVVVGRAVSVSQPIM